jgi:hypothetical protein
MITFNNVKFKKHPYPIGISKPVWEKDLYNQLVEQFPPADLGLLMGAWYGKFTMSERFNTENYYNFLNKNPLWMKFYKYVKSREFFESIRKVLKKNKILLPVGQYSTRFEFSWIPAKDGFILPHTDIASKVVTLILPMVKPDEWMPEWGGGTDVLKPKYDDKKYTDYKNPLEDFDIVRTYPYEPNQCVIFIKSENSWHSVGPFKGINNKIFRKTLTVNVEKVK